MLYFILRPLLRLALQVYFRKIYLHGLEHIPTSGPLILACNHPSAFFEGCLLACYQPRSLYFMVRGDVFVKPFYRRLLVALHQIPIYRFVDGFANLRHNPSTMAASYEVLAQGKTILIFSEGRTIYEKKLQPIQKGTARMAFGAMEQMKLPDIPIVPVGVNYTYFNVFRSEVMINFGPPIHAKSYYDLSFPPQNADIVALTNELEHRLKALTINVADSANEPLFNRLAATHRPPSFTAPWPAVIYGQEAFHHELAIAERVNHGTSFTPSVPVIKVAWWKKIPYYILSLFWVIPFYGGKRIADHRVNSAPFYGPVWFAVSTLLSVLQWIILTIAAILCWGWKGIPLIIILLLVSYLALLLQDKPWHPDETKPKW